MSAVVIENGLVHYEVIGRGTPLVFVHGWLGSWRYWVPTMEGLSVNYRAYALDLWGFGDSDKVQANYHVDSYVDLLEKFLDQLGLWRVSLVGHALGGAVSLLFAANFPERVERVMGVSVPLLPDTVNRPLTTLSGNGDSLAKLVTRRANFPEVDMEARKADAQAVIESLQSVMTYDMRYKLPIDIPSLLVYGTSDALIQPPQEEWMKNFLDDDIRMILLDDVQHFPMLEERNKFNRLLLDFLDVNTDLSSIDLKEEWQRRMR
jgi:pimeloyl-ACP methyl ester carboxylesterase